MSERIKCVEREFEGLLVSQSASFRYLNLGDEPGISTCGYILRLDIRPDESDRASTKTVEGFIDLDEGNDLLDRMKEYRGRVRATFKPDPLRTRRHYKDQVTIVDVHAFESVELLD